MTFRLRIPVRDSAIAFVLLGSAFFSVLFPSLARAEAYVSNGAYFADESSPDEIAADLADELGEKGWKNGDDPGDRFIPPEDYGKYGIVVDVFRKSGKRPVLGTYRNDYSRIVSRARFDRLADSEFAVVSVDGVPIKANLVSGALEREIDQAVKKNGVVQYDPVTKAAVTRKSLKYTPFGAFKLTTIPMDVRVPTADGTGTEVRTLPFPFPTSKTYASPMYWGLRIFGGYLIHSTPHTSQLGQPASMGCIRQSFPDAMELWNLVANSSGGRDAMIRIHAMHSLEAYVRLREIVYDPSYFPNDPKYGLTPEGIESAALPNEEKNLRWLIRELNRNYDRLKTYVSRYGREYHGVGYAWVDPRTHRSPKPVFPQCGGYDCFKIWGDPIKALNAELRAQSERERKNRLALGIDENPAPETAVADGEDR